MLVHGSALPPLSIVIEARVAEINPNHCLKYPVVHNNTPSKLLFWSPPILIFDTVAVATARIFSRILQRCRNRDNVRYQCKTFCRYSKSKLSLASVGILAAAMVITSCSSSAAEEEGETLSNVPQMLSGECVLPKDCKKPRIQKPKSRKAEACTSKCVGTCIRGGEGSPGEGPFNIRRPLVVFKDGFRSRKYCLVECSDICNLIGDGDDGP